MKWFLCAAFSVLLLAVNLVNAVQNQEFRERAEIYSSKWCLIINEIIIIIEK